jgi:hypothetical protein
MQVLRFLFYDWVSEKMHGIQILFIFMLTFVTVTQLNTICLIVSPGDVNQRQAKP